MAETLSDKELREQLKAFGEKTIGPITSTTRSIYLKKLNHYKARGKNDSAKSTTQVSKKLLGFSSDESGGEDTGGRQTSRRRSRQVRQPAPRPPIPTFEPSTKRRSTNLRRKGIRSSSRLQADDSQNDEEDESTAADMLSFNMQTSMNNTYSNDSVDNSLPIPHHEEAFESSDSDFDPLPSNVNNSGDINMSRGSDFTKVPYTNVLNFPTTSRLESTTQSPSYTQPYQRKPKVYAPIQPVSSSISYSTNDEEEKYRKHGFKTKDDHYSKWPHYISMFLLVLAALFFLTLGFMYISMRGNVTDQDKSSSINLLCSSQDKQTPGCLTPDQLDNAKSVVREIATLLGYRAGDYQCGKITDTATVTADQLRESIKCTDKAFNDALKLIANNPNWNMRLLDSIDEEISDGIKNENNNVTEVIRLESLSPILSLYCRLIKSVYEVLSIFVFIIIGALIVTAIIAVMHWRYRKKEQEAAQIYEMVERIIEILCNHSDNVQHNKDLQPYLAIPHVRDMLIPPQERRKKQILWDRACKFLSANESRVRVETQKIEGEEFAVWRWLPQSHANGSKVWQGQACGEKESSMILPRKTNTPCLKVRNMFDLDVEYEQDWHIAIQDAILEKCGVNHGIVHIAVDKTSKEGCVFVKCSSPQAAGEAFRSLQAWWFDGKLVTVKFLRLERYHERFPDAIHTGSEPLKPSNNSCRSLSQPFHKSIMESS